MEKECNCIIIVSSEIGVDVAKKIEQVIPGCLIYSKSGYSRTIKVEDIDLFLSKAFLDCASIIFIGAMGICVRLIANHLKNKNSDPAIINIDSTGKFVTSVLSGHVGGANSLCEVVARYIGAIPVVSTLSDNLDLWPLDTLPKRFDWSVEIQNTSLNNFISGFLNSKRCALVLDVKDLGTEYLENTLPRHVTILNPHDLDAVKYNDYELLIFVSHKLISSNLPTIIYRPKVLHLGVGCGKNCKIEGVGEHIEKQMIICGYSPKSIKSISTIDLKKDEPLLTELTRYFSLNSVNIFSSSDLSSIKVPNPSLKVKEVTDTSSVSEASAILSAQIGELIIQKQKCHLQNDQFFTYSVALERDCVRSGIIEIVGAGPGDPDLISVRGKKLLERADLVLYAGSLVPIELTRYAPAHAQILSSAHMTLEEQVLIMKKYYDKGKLVVRLHTGDPSIYGAIQEQMAFFDKFSMNYRITPGISSFLAAAAALKSQFTIPDKVQTIILTRGEGRTSMPEKESLAMLAKSQSTMCIFLSAAVVEHVQEQLLEHYPPTTPIAVCHKLTWKDEKIFRGLLSELSFLVKSNNLTLTTMIVVGEAIGNRQGLSKLYSDNFKHLFRK